MTTKDINPISVPSIEALETAHTFPTNYTIKVIGPDTQTFRENSKTICQKHIGEDGPVNISERQSKSGQHLSLTLKFNVSTPILVQEIYRDLAKLQGLKFII